MGLRSKPNQGINMIVRNNIQQQQQQQEKSPEKEKEKSGR